MKQAGDLGYSLDIYRKKVSELEAPPIAPSIVVKQLSPTVKFYDTTGDGTSKDYNNLLIYFNGTGFIARSRYGKSIAGKLKEQFPGYKVYEIDPPLLPESTLRNSINSACKDAIRLVKIFKSFDKLSRIIVSGYSSGGVYAFYAVLAILSHLRATNSSIGTEVALLLFSPSLNLKKFGDGNFEDPTLKKWVVNFIWGFLLNDKEAYNLSPVYCFSDKKLELLSKIKLAVVSGKNDFFKSHIGEFITNMKKYDKDVIDITGLNVDHSHMWRKGQLEASVLIACNAIEGVKLIREPVVGMAWLRELMLRINQRTATTLFAPNGAKNIKDLMKTSGAQKKPPWKVSVFLSLNFANKAQNEKQADKGMLYRGYLG